MRSLCCWLLLCCVPTIGCHRPSGAAGSSGASAAPNSEAGATSSGTATSRSLSTNALPPASAAPIPQVTITFKVTNLSNEPRSTNFGRNFWDAVKLDRLDGSTWVNHDYASFSCARECPADGSAPKCGFCSPPIPAPDPFPPKKTQIYYWTGTQTQYVETSPTCGCTRLQAAPRGRYRLRGCFRTVKCPKPPCLNADGRFVPYAEPDKELPCVEKEFVLGDKDQTVEIGIR